LSSSPRGLADGDWVSVFTLPLSFVFTLPLPVAPPDVSVDVEPLALVFELTSTPTLGFAPMFGFTFGLMVVFCASAGPTPTTSAVNEAAAIET
jgi:hypothetical protein